MNAAARKKPVASRSPARRPETLVYGIGQTGLSVARFLSRNGVEAVYVDSRDEPPGLDDLRDIVPDAEVVLGAPSTDLLAGVTRLIVSPGIPDRDALVTAARRASIAVVSDIELFTHEALADIVAITGSNGKSTVTTLLSLMCDAAGRKALAGANLGLPALDLLAEPEPELYLLELSSFQLMRTEYLPAKVAVLLNVAADHLDWHRDEAEYRAAKYRVFDQARSAVVNRDDPDVFDHLAPELKRVSFGLDAPDEGQYGIVADAGVDFLARGTLPLLACADMAMLGRHNCANALAAMAAGELIGIEVPPMLEVLNEFPGLPHRMQFVANVRGVDYVNDSKATNVDAAIASVCSIEGPVVLLAGGQGKGGDFQMLARAVARRLRAVIVFGEDAGLLAEAFKDKVPLYLVGGLRDAVARARELAASGDTVLLAPACASFDQFENYMQRGDAFTAAVRGLSA